MSQALPANPNLEWLRKAAKQRLVELRARQPDAKLHQAHLLVANDHGFKSWRALKTHIDGTVRRYRNHERVFAAARSGDIETVRRAFASGFDPATQDADGRTLHQIAKDLRLESLELLARDAQTGNRRTKEEAQAIQQIVRAAQSGDIEALGRHLDARPDLIDALGGTGFKKATALHLAVLHNQHAAIRLLIDQGADLDRRDFPDNAAPLHFAAVHGDRRTIELLVEAGADIDGNGDDYNIGVLGWATCFGQTRHDVANYLLQHGATFNLWTAIALGRADDLREMIARDPALLAARMTRNHHRRTLLHHAAARGQVQMVRLLLELGAEPNATDATGANALTTAMQENADPAIVASLQAAGAQLDLLAAIDAERYQEAEAMLRAQPSRLGQEGSDTIALHIAVSKRNVVAVRWLLDHGVDVNAKRSMWDCNHTALQMTVENGSIDIAQTLLAAGADPNIRDDKFNATALGWADFFGRRDFATLIQAHGGIR